MAQKSIESLVDEKDNFIDAAENGLIDDFDPIENAIYNAAIKEVNKMDQEDGKVKFSEANLIILSYIAEAMIMAMQKSDYPSKVQEYIGSFDKVGRYNIRIQNRLNGLDIAEMQEAVAPIQGQIAQQVLNGLTGQGINTQFVSPVTETIYKNIVSGASIDDLKNALQTLIKSDTQRLGLFKRYVSQISRDAIMQYEGQINAYFSTKYDFNAYLYVGGLVRDSRPQCVVWNGMGILPKATLGEEIAKAYISGSGMIPGTTVENFAVYRGGYNCRHTAIPTRIK